MRVNDARLQNIGWRLQSANAPYCDDIRFATGLTVDDAAAYGDPAGMRAANGLIGDFVVQSVALGSPAARAGIVPGMEISHIGGVELARLPVSENRRWARAIELAALLSPAEANAVVLRLSNAETPITLLPRAICASKLEWGASGQEAVADGARVVLNADAMAHGDDHLAAIVAHELAHNVLRHRAFLDANGRKRRDVRATEREADRLMPWLLANAGYDPAVAAQFMAYWGPRNHRSSTRHHDRWQDRLARIEAELPIVAASIARHGSADWKRDFAPQFARKRSPR